MAGLACASALEDRGVRSTVFDTVRDFAFPVFLIKRSVFYRSFMIFPVNFEGDAWFRGETGDENG